MGGNSPRQRLTASAQQVADQHPDHSGGGELPHTLHDWDEDGVRRILERCYAALAPGGWLVDHDTHLNRNKTGPLIVARYSVLLMHGTSGRCWSVAELEETLADVGFVSIEERPAAGDRSLILGRKPG